MIDDESFPWTDFVFFFLLRSVTCRDLYVYKVQLYTCICGPARMGESFPMSRVIPKSFGVREGAYLWPERSSAGLWKARACPIIGFSICIGTDLG